MRLEERRDTIKKKVFVLAIALIFVVLFIVCAVKIAGRESSEIRFGMYSYDFNEESEFLGADFNITFAKDGTYSYYEGLLSSYIGSGTYSIENGVLKTEDEVFDLVNYFRVDGDSIYFIEEGSTNFLYVKVRDGQSFTYREDE